MPALIMHQTLDIVLTSIDYKSSHKTPSNRSSNLSSGQFYGSLLCRTGQWVNATIQEKYYSFHLFFSLDGDVGDVVAIYNEAYRFLEQ